MSLQRIAKFISNRGVCSRRGAELLIAQGVVKVDDVIITSPVTFVDDNSKVEVHDKLLSHKAHTRLWVYYKPVSLITTHEDPANRLTVFSTLKELPRVISIGRLDINSEGLLLLTTDGALARWFELPANQVQRVYRVRAYGDAQLITTLKFPLIIDDVIYTPKSIKLLGTNIRKKANSWYEVILTEGKNKEIRRIFNYCGLQVNRLIRISYGPFRLDNLVPGEYREVQVPAHFINKAHAKENE